MHVASLQPNLPVPLTHFLSCVYKANEAAVVNFFGTDRPNPSIWSVVTEKSTTENIMPLSTHGSSGIHDLPIQPPDPICKRVEDVAFEENNDSGISRHSIIHSNGEQPRHPKIRVESEQDFPQLQPAPMDDAPPNTAPGPDLPFSYENVGVANVGAPCDADFDADTAI